MCECVYDCVCVYCAATLLCSLNLSSLVCSLTSLAQQSSFSVLLGDYVHCSCAWNFHLADARVGSIGCCPSGRLADSSLGGTLACQRTSSLAQVTEDVTVTYRQCVHVCVCVCVCVCLSMCVVHTLTFNHNSSSQCVLTVDALLSLMHVGTCAVQPITTFSCGTYTSASCEYMPWLGGLVCCSGIF
jgi:hypothetical protein